MSVNRKLLTHLRKLVTRNNTKIYTYSGETIYFDLHITCIVKWNTATGVVTVQNGGWYSSTTKNRINEILNALKIPYQVYQHKWKWYWSEPRNSYDPKTNKQFEVVNVFDKKDMILSADKCYYMGNTVDFNLTPIAKS